MGTISVMTKFGRKLIHNVTYVPDLAQNLLSLGQLMRKGYYVVFDNYGCMIYDKRNRNLLYSVKMTENKMFPIRFSDVVVNGFGASTDDSMIWHRRFCHLNFVGLYLLQRMNMVAGLSMVKDDHSKVCEACVFGKQHRDRFSVGKSWRAIKPLMLVHVDLCSPMYIS